MDPRWGVFIHKSCSDTWTILSNGSLKNDGDSLCMAIEGSNTNFGTSIKRESCTGFSRQVWQPYLINIGNPPGKKLGMCEGDCDSSSDCKSGYKCSLRGDSRIIPGCAGDSSAYPGRDYCVPQYPLLVSIDWDVSRILGMCEGDCDKDSDCQAGLVCFHRKGIEAVPGCSGTGRNSMGYCTIPPSTSAPTSAPTFSVSCSSCHFSVLIIFYFADLIFLISYSLHTK